jgi:hypothetical protein
VRLFIDTPHPHLGQGEVLDGVREILDGVVERQKPENPTPDEIRSGVMVDWK